MAIPATTKATAKKAPTRKIPPGAAPKLTARNGGRDWREVFLETLAKTGNITLSAKKAKVDRANAYRIRGEEKEFAEAWDNALADSGDLLEQEARRRAAKGVRKPVYQGGKLVGYVQEYSDTLLIFLLKGAKPEKYRERFEHSGPKGGAIPVSLDELIDKSYGDNDQPDDNGETTAAS